MSETFIGMPGVVSDDANALAHTGGWRTTVTIPEDTLRWGPTFPQGAHKTLANTQMRRNLGHATRTIRAKRAQRGRTCAAPPRPSSSRSPRACPNYLRNSNAT